MAIGKFDETSEKNETNETKEATDNNEKKRNQILATSLKDGYEDDFDKKLDENEKYQDGMKENSDKGEKNDFFSKFKDKFDEIKDRFSKKDNSDDKSESKEESEKKDNGHHTESENSFKDKIKVDTPIKVPEGGEEYKKAREESDKANEKYPDRKSWELTPEKLEEIRDGQQEIAKKYNSENDEN